MKLYYHKTDGGAEYYCYKSIDQTGRNPFNTPSDEGDTTTAIIRTDGHEIEIYPDQLEKFGISLMIRNRIKTNK